MCTLKMMITSRTEQIAKASITNVVQRPSNNVIFYIVLLAVHFPTRSSSPFQPYSNSQSATGCHKRSRSKGLMHSRSQDPGSGILDEIVDFSSNTGSHELKFAPFCAPGCHTHPRPHPQSPTPRPRPPRPPPRPPPPHAPRTRSRRPQRRSQRGCAARCAGSRRAGSRGQQARSWGGIWVRRIYIEKTHRKNRVQR
jgi:hypothetical protein